MTLYRGRLKRFRLVFTVLVLGLVLVGLLTRSSGLRGGLATFPPVPEPRFASMPAERGTSRLRVRVVDPAGAPLAGVGIHVRSGDVPVWGFSDADGRVELGGLEEGELEVFALLFRRPPSVVRLAPDDTEHTIALGEEAQIPAPLPAITRATFVGELVPATGAVLAATGYEVHLLPLAPAQQLGGPVPRRAECGPAGEFTLEGLAHGRYRAVVVPAWGAGSLWPDLADPEHATIDHAGAPAGAMAATRIPLATGSIEGRVLDDNDRPLEDALVLLALAGTPNRVWLPIVSDTDGRFRVPEMPSGAYRLTVRAGEGEVEAQTEVRTGATTHVGLPALSPRQRSVP